jgi:uncharacterized protein YgbK (DUF1537 family)
MTKTIAILADDLTGANDTGVQFSRLGGSVLVLVSMDRLPPAVEQCWDVLVVNTGTRNMTPAEAQARVKEVWAYLRRHAWPLVYKKIDSTLRGNVVPELQALFACGVPGAVLAPAFPLNGRTVEGGVLMVGGTPVHQTEAGRDGLSPVTSGDMVAMLTGSLPAKVAAIGLDVIDQGAIAIRAAFDRWWREGRTVIVCDSRTQGDLAELTRAVQPELPGPVLVGSAGLARELAAAWLPDARSHASTPRTPRALVVAGSRSVVTARQLACLRRTGIAGEYVVDPACVDSGWSAAQCDKLARSACDALLAQAPPAAASGPIWLVTIGADEQRTPPERFHERSGRLNRLLGATIAQLERRRPGTGLVLTGGDVAAAAIEALGAVGIQLAAEVLPGIPCGTLAGGDSAGIPLVTKAGAFGPDDALVAAVHALLGD